MSNQRIPKLSPHKASGQGVVRLNGHDHYCGPLHPLPQNWPLGMVRWNSVHQITTSLPEFDPMPKPRASRITISREDEQALIARAQAGDQQAQLELWDLFQVTVHQIIWKYLRTSPRLEFEDAVQVVWMKGFREALKYFKPEKKCRFDTLWNLSLNVLLSSLGLGFMKLQIDLGKSTKMNSVNAKELQVISGSEIRRYSRNFLWIGQKTREKMISKPDMPWKEMPR